MADSSIVSRLGVVADRSRRCCDRCRSSGTTHRLLTSPTTTTSTTSTIRTLSLHRRRQWLLYRLLVWDSIFQLFRSFFRTHRSFVRWCKFRGSQCRQCNSNHLRQSRRWRRRRRNSRPLRLVSSIILILCVCVCVFCFFSNDSNSCAHLR
jgi:hypothetical protein